MPMRMQARELNERVHMQMPTMWHFFPKHDAIIENVMSNEFVKWFH